MGEGTSDKDGTLESGPAGVIPSRSSSFSIWLRDRFNSVKEGGLTRYLHPRQNQAQQQGYRSGTRAALADYYKDVHKNFILEGLQDQIQM
jgi:hypothetical protein